MAPHYGHGIFRSVLSRRYRRLYRQCDLAICTSDGMKEELGDHSNAVVVYPMPGRHGAPGAGRLARPGKFRLVYVGAAQRFYGRMLRALLAELRGHSGVELVVVGPDSDWPAEELREARAAGQCLGFMPPGLAAEVLAGADALLVVMSFEREEELFMRTSFTTKFLDYCAYGKPIILWGPDYCTPSRVARREQGALVVSRPDPRGVVAAAESLANSPAEVSHYAAAAGRLHETVFNPDRLQRLFVDRMTALVHA
jgi:hypothetical protein